MNATTPSALDRQTDVSAKSPRRWLREPLLHFFVFGGLLFALDSALVSRRDSGTVILLNAGADAELQQIVRDELGREPTAIELAAMRRRWFDNELLYREGLALGLDRGDTSIRERVIFKALNVVQANLVLPKPDDVELRAWFEANRSRYDNPPRIDFLEAVIAGKPSLAEAETFATVLNSKATTKPDTDVESGLRIYRGRPLSTLTPAFGEAFTTQLATLPLNRWVALNAQDGPRAVLVEKRADGQPAEFEPLREKVLLDWRDQRMAELRSEAVHKLGDKYRLTVAGEAS